MSRALLWLYGVVCLLLSAVVPTFVGPTLAQSGPGSGSGAGDTKARPLPAAVSALSAEEIAGLKAGKGMGFGAAAELNDHPGPHHVLELAGPLALSEAQRQRVQVIYDTMRAKAVTAGNALIEAEHRLADSFKSGSAQPVTLTRLVRQVEEARADLRIVHLSAHLETTPVLTPAQRQRYRELRRAPQGSQHGVPPRK